MEYTGGRWFDAENWVNALRFNDGGSFTDGK